MPYLDLSLRTLLGLLDYWPHQNSSDVHESHLLAEYCYFRSNLDWWLLLRYWCYVFFHFDSSQVSKVICSAFFQIVTKFPTFDFVQVIATLKFMFALFELQEYFVLLVGVEALLFPCCGHFLIFVPNYHKNRKLFALFLKDQQRKALAQVYQLWSILPIRLTESLITMGL